MINNGEACDDGNRAGGDSCSADCKTVTTPPSTTIVPTIIK